MLRKTLVYPLVERSYPTRHCHRKHFTVSCRYGRMARYETGLHLLDAGVISGFDATVESVLTKLMFLFGHNLTPKEVRNEMNRSIAGEFTRPEL